MTWLMIPTNYEHSTYSAESAESHLHYNRGVRLSAIVKSTHTPPGFSSRTWQKVISTLPRFGVMLELSDNPELTGLVPSSVSLGVSPVKTLAVPEKELESQENGQGCSLKLSESFAWLDRESSSWKTCQQSLFGGWEPFSENWPKAGMMQNGECYRQPKLEHRICEIGGGLWPTLTARDYRNSSDGARNTKAGPDLIGFLCRLTGESGIRLIPSFAEEFMGYPIGWTDLGV